MVVVRMTPVRATFKAKMELTKVDVKDHISRCRASDRAKLFSMSFGGRNQMKSYSRGWFIVVCVRLCVFVKHSAKVRRTVDGSGVSNGHM